MGFTTINIDTKQIDRLTKELNGFPKEVGTAAFYSINRAVDHVYTQIGRIVPQSYQIKSSDVKSTLKKNLPSKTNLSASVESVGSTLSFAHFPFTPKAPRTAKRSIFESAVMVTIKKGQRVLSKKGFVMSTGAKSQDKVQYNVFKRLGQARFPIAPIRTLSIPQMITNEKVGEKVQQSAQDMLEKRFDHEITRIMTSMDKRVRR